MNNEFVVNSKRKTEFIIYNSFILPQNTVPRLNCLPTYKCSQDHLEVLFSSIRAQGGSTCRQFRCAYKKLLVHADIKDGGILYWKSVYLQPVIKIQGNISIRKY
jgi:hypothetical protein